MAIWCHSSKRNVCFLKPYIYQTAHTHSLFLCVCLCLTDAFIFHFCSTSALITHSVYAFLFGFSFSVSIYFRAIWKLTAEIFYRFELCHSFCVPSCFYEVYLLTVRLWVLRWKIYKAKKKTRTLNKERKRAREQANESFMKHCLSIHAHHTHKNLVREQRNQIYR